MSVSQCIKDEEESSLFLMRNDCIFIEMLTRKRVVRRDLLVNNAVILFKSERIVGALYRKNGPYAIFMYLIAAGFLFYEMGVQTSPSVMTADLMRDFGISAVGLGIAMGAYFISYATMQIPVGLLLDRFSLKKLLSFAVALCVLGAFAFAVAEHVIWLGISRFMVGIGSAFAFVSVLIVSMQWFSKKYFALLVGLAQLLAAIGALLGEAPLASLVHTLHWRPAMQSITIAGGILLLLTLIFMRDYPESQKTQAVQSEKKEPMLKSLTTISQNKQTWWLALYAFALWAPVTAFAELWGVPYLVAVYHVTETAAAFAVQMIWVGLAVASPILGWWSDHVKRRCSLLSLFAGMGVLSSAIAIMVPGLSFGWMKVMLFIFGMATAGQILSFAVVRDINRPSVVATGIGLNNMAVVLGGVVFQPLVGWLLDTFSARDAMMGGVPLYSAHAYRLALLVVPICFLLGFIASYFGIEETYCETRYPD